MSKSDDYLVGDYVASFIDILGQKKKLAIWASLPVGKTPTPDLVNVIKETAGTVLDYRNRFVEFFKAAGKQSNPDWSTSLSRDQQMAYQRVNYGKLSIQQFADSFVFYFPISNPFGDLTTILLYKNLNACAMAMLVSLGFGVPVRGAVTLGAGVELEECTFYGPALVEASYLEAKVAKYPRVIVSKKVQSFLAEGQIYSSDSDVHKVMAGIAVNCRALLAEDDDGQCIVDYVGKGMLGIVGQETVWPECVRKVYDFAVAKERCFIAEGDSKLAPRYTRLRKYLESRLSIWGLDSTVD